MIKKLLQNIFSIKNENQHKVFRIFFLKFKFYNEKLTNKKIDNYFYNLKTYIEAAALHPQVFGKYKNAFQDKEVVIVGCGPTALHYKPIPNAIHIGVNRAFKLENVNFDFMFITENFPNDDELLLLDSYKPETCVKFYLKQSLGIRKNFCNPSPKYYHYNNKNVYEYICIDKGINHIYPNDISYEPLYIAASTVFQALQLALFGGTKRIYLVGCDVKQTGHFYKEKEKVLLTNIDGLFESWKYFKSHVEYNYPKLEIISINPVALKGMFKDVYTKSFIDEHNELSNKDVEILKEYECLNQ